MKLRGKVSFGLAECGHSKGVVILRGSLYLSVRAISIALILEADAVPGKKYRPI